MEKDNDLPSRGTGLSSGNAGERRNGIPRTNEEREDRHEELTKNPPFGKWEDWDACIAEMTPKYGEENAKRVCGALKRDLEKDMLAGPNTKEESDLTTLTSLVQELSTKVEELSAKITERPEDLNKSFEEYGYIKVPEPEMPVHNLPITKSQTPLSAKELEQMPWSEIHKAAQKAKR